jgi:hypothetical protein
MAKYARLSGNNRLTVRQVEVVLESLVESENQFYYDKNNERNVLDNAALRLHTSIPANGKTKYAFLGRGNRMTQVQLHNLTWFLEGIIQSYRKSKPQVHRVLFNALVILKDG